MPVSSSEITECIRCVMTSDADKEITFSETGLCNHCIRYDSLVTTRVVTGTRGLAKLDKLVAQIKATGNGKDYDCLIGVSGGVDSTYVAYKVKQLGLRPLAVHLDNGWNSELAVGNIEKILKKLKIDLITYVIDWNEFRDLQLSFLKGSTPDGEVPTDHAIYALLWKMAAKHRIKYIISGMNFTTESMSVPAWSYGHSDWRYIKDVHRRLGSRTLKTYPHYNFLYLFWITFIRRIRTVSILNYIDYNKNEVMQFLQNEFGWVSYGGKHYESNYTKFYQGYVLPVKFGVDKRYAHFSDLINAGQMNKEEAKKALKDLPYDISNIEAEKLYIQKKLGLTESEFDLIMTSPIRSYRDYKNSYWFVGFLKNLVNYMRKIGIYPR